MLPGSLSLSLLCFFSAHPSRSEIHQPSPSTVPELVSNPPRVYCTAVLTLLTIRTPPTWTNTDYDDDRQPKAESLINVNVSCDGWAAEGGGGVGDVGANYSTPSSPCSDGSCLNGDFGVYCLCYVRESDSKEVRAYGRRANPVDMIASGFLRDVSHPQTREPTLMREVV